MFQKLLTVFRGTRSSEFDGLTASVAIDEHWACFFPYNGNEWWLRLSICQTSLLVFHGRKKVMRGWTACRWVQDDRCFIFLGWTTPLRHNMLSAWMGSYGNWAWLSRTAHPHISSHCNAALEGKYLWYIYIFSRCVQDWPLEFLIKSFDVCKVLFGSFRFSLTFTFWYYTKGFP